MYQEYFINIQPHSDLKLKVILFDTTKDTREYFYKKYKKTHNYRAWVDRMNTNKVLDTNILCELHLDKERFTDKDVGRVLEHELIHVLMDYLRYKHFFAPKDERVHVSDYIFYQTTQREEELAVTYTYLLNKLKILLGVIEPIDEKLLIQDFASNQCHYQWGTCHIYDKQSVINNLDRVMYIDHYNDYYKPWYSSTINSRRVQIDNKDNRWVIFPCELYDKYTEGPFWNRKHVVILWVTNGPKLSKDKYYVDKEMFNNINYAEIRGFKFYSDTKLNRWVWDKEILNN